MAHRRRRARCLLAGFGAMLLGAGTGGAPGEVVAQTVLRSPIEIAACLCLERDLGTRQAEMTVRRNAYEGLARDIQEAEASLERDRARVDVNDAAAVDGFRRRVDALDAMKVRQSTVALPDYQAAIAGYNERVAQYTQRCSGRPIDQATLERVRSDLVCRTDP